MTAIVRRLSANCELLSAEWELVVSMLIGEAAAAVVFAEGLTDGLTRELELVEMLKSLEKTTVLIIKPDDDFAALFLSEADRNARHLAPCARHAI